jgi:hypothetical protein
MVVNHVVYRIEKGTQRGVALITNCHVHGGDKVGHGALA